MVNAIHLTMSSKDQIATWKANRRKLVCAVRRRLLEHIAEKCVSLGLLDRRDARLHCSRNLLAEGLRKRV